MRYNLTVVLGAACLMACPPTEESPPPSADSGSFDDVSTSERLPSRVTARVDLSTPQVVVGTPLTIRLVVANRGPREAALSFSGTETHRFDFAVIDSKGREVWSRLHHEDIDLTRFVLPLRSGDSVVFTDRWNQQTNDTGPLTPGWDTVRGYIPPRASGDSGIASARLRVCGREGC